DKLQLICQDSLEVFDHDFNITNNIIITEDDRLVEDSLYEPVICNSAIIDLKDIIKEYIILDLPLIPKKETSNCKNTKKHSYYREQESVIQEKNNPFEIL
ncbi:YceD family protein, partial [Francisella tularensis subsp. holarctica]|uniref:YceD family protein n=1 Tax=Francisella tularensis TaxID=263 RepID=UPI002381BB84